MALKFIFVNFIAIALFASSRAGVIGGVSYAHADPTVDTHASSHQNVVRSFGGTVSQYSKTIDTPYASVRKEDNVYTPTIAKTVTYAVPKSKTINAPTKQLVYTQTASVADKAQHTHEHHEPAAVYATHEHHHDENSAHYHHAPTIVHSHAEPIPENFAHHHHAPATVHSHAESIHENFAHHHHAPATVYSHAATIHENVAHHHAPTTVHSHAESIHENFAHHHHAPATVYSHAKPITTKTVSYASPIVKAVPVVNYHHYTPAVATATTTYDHSPDASTYSHNAPGNAAYGTSKTVSYSPAEMVSHMSFDGFGTHWGF